MNNKTRKIVILGVLAAICYIGTWIHIPIYLGGAKSMIHLGTTAIFIAATIVGKDAFWPGAIGCALFDLLSPGFQAWAIPTFIVKGLTGYVTGKVAFANNKEGKSVKQNTFAFVLGGIVSLVGYFLFNAFIFTGWRAALISLSTSITTTAIGAAIAIPMSFAIKKKLHSSYNV
ncbi:ECF transporter S component [Clostridium frigidicarnis]|uniref:Uncharacterized membrane protein n=1 Tax=Clostridium frigidicarnis TaxID=84698 RepID=A0A1I1ALC5_9CLOT|nr:ECF transporter S component [Clostridium frigidicarnis]SFB38829.1 Uncharacterized membrane protein [Clostridium frigidicarnis]